MQDDSILVRELDLRVDNLRLHNTCIVCHLLDGRYESSDLQLLARRDVRLNLATCLLDDMSELPV